MTDVFKKRLTKFNDMRIFGKAFKTSITSAFNSVAVLLHHNKVNHDGTIDVQNVGMFSINELWYYIYYLYHYNNQNISEFAEMRDHNGYARADLFYKSVYKTVKGKEYIPKENELLTPLSEMNLIEFINDIIARYPSVETFPQTGLINPVFDYIKIIIEKKIEPRLIGFKLKTGIDKNNNLKVEIIPKDNANIEDAPIKVTVIKS